MVSKMNPHRDDLRLNSQWSAAHNKHNDIDQIWKQERLILIFTHWISGHAYIIGFCVTRAIANYINYEFAFIFFVKVAEKEKISIYGSWCEHPKKKHLRKAEEHVHVINKPTFSIFFWAPQPSTNNSLAC